jgi:hypothetical protein
MEALETIQHDVERELELKLVVATRADYGRPLVWPAGCDGGPLGGCHRASGAARTSS